MYKKGKERKWYETSLGERHPVGLSRRTTSPRVAKTLSESGHCLARLRDHKALVAPRPLLGLAASKDKFNAFEKNVKEQCVQSCFSCKSSL